MYLKIPNKASEEERNLGYGVFLAKLANRLFYGFIKWVCFHFIYLANGAKTFDLQIYARTKKM